MREDETDLNSNENRISLITEEVRQNIFYQTFTCRTVDELKQKQDVAHY